MNPEGGCLNKPAQIMMLWRIIRKWRRKLPPKWGCSDMITYQPYNGAENAAEGEKKRKKLEKRLE